MRGFVEASPGAGGAPNSAAAAAAWLKSCRVEPAALRLGDAGALRALHEAAKTLVFGTIHGVASRPAYRQFARLGRGEHAGEPRLATLRDLAAALAGKMEDENALLLSIVEHRRTVAGVGPGRTPPMRAAQPQREASR